MRQAFVWIMFQTFKYVSRHGYSREPQQVIEATENYKINNDSFLQFTNERIIKDESPDCEGITLSEFHNLYKEWYRETYNNSNNCPNKNELKEYLYKKWGVARLNKWKKYRIRTIKDDELEGELLALRPEDYTDNEE
jgi:phage/plasmid-associated DNA primase